MDLSGSSEGEVPAGSVLTNPSVEIHFIFLRFFVLFLGPPL